MTCDDCGMRVRRADLATDRVCTSCILHPGWRHERGTRHILLGLKRLATGDDVIGPAVAISDEQGRWTKLGAQS